MYSYSIIQWLFFFYFYCFFGWCFESAYVSLLKRKLVNRGFMRGPFLPLYGSGAIMMLLVSKPFQQNIFMVYIAGCIGATVLEYVTGVVMEALFKVRYWDYSKQPFNFQGHICLGSSLAWGGLTILMTEVIHIPVEKLGYAIPSTLLTALTILLTVLLVWDFALSFMAALDLRDILVKMEKSKEELMRMQRRLDVIIAVADKEITVRKEAISEAFELKMESIEEKLKLDELKESLGERFRLDELKESIEERLERLKNINTSEYLDNVREEIAEMRIKYRMSMENRDKLGGIRNFYKRNMIRSNPTMRSVRFKDSFEELKKMVEERSRSRKKKEEQKKDGEDSGQ